MFCDPTHMHASCTLLSRAVQGAPERVLELCDPSSIPEDIYEHFDAAQRPGCIVLAVACKVLADTRPEYL